MDVKMGRVEALGSFARLTHSNHIQHHAIGKAAFNVERPVPRISWPLFFKPTVQPRDSSGLEAIALRHSQHPNSGVRLVIVNLEFGSDIKTREINIMCGMLRLLMKSSKMNSIIQTKYGAADKHPYARERC